MSKKLIADVMTKFPYTIGEDQDLEFAKKQMYQHNIRHLPVLAGGRCVGLLSDRDLKLAYALDQDKLSSLRVKDVCSADVYEAAPDTELSIVAQKMYELKIGSAVVIEKGKVIGIFTATDACRVIAEEA